MFQLYLFLYWTSRAAPGWSYYANSIQLRLDLLFKAPSQYLPWASSLIMQHGTLHVFASLINWILSTPNWRKAAIPPVWTQIGKHLSSTTLIFYCKCISNQILEVPCTGFIQILGVSFLVHNSYNTVFKVLLLLRNTNAHSLHSFDQFTYYDDIYILSRLDFTKERFGGPFINCQNISGNPLYILFSIRPVLNCFRSTGSIYYHTMWIRSWSCYQFVRGHNFLYPQAFMDQ